MADEEDEEDKEIEDELIHEGDMGNVGDDTPRGQKWWSGIIEGIFDEKSFLFKHNRYPWLFRLPISLILFLCQVPGLLLNVGIELFKERLMGFYEFILNAVTLGKYNAANITNENYYDEKSLGALQYLLDPTISLRKRDDNPENVAPDVLSRTYSFIIFLMVAWEQITETFNGDNVAQDFLQLLHKMLLMVLIIPLAVGKLAFNIVDFTLDQILVVQYLLTGVLPKILLNIPLIVVDSMKPSDASGDDDDDVDAANPFLTRLNKHFPKPPSQPDVVIRQDRAPADSAPTSKWWSGLVSGLKESYLLSKHTEYPWLFRFPITVVLFVTHLPGMFLRMVIEQFQTLTAVYDFVLNAATRGRYMQLRKPSVEDKASGDLFVLSTPEITFQDPSYSFKPKVEDRIDTLLSFGRAALQVIRLPPDPKNNRFYKALDVWHKIGLIVLILPLSLGKLAFNMLDFTLEQVWVIQCLLTVSLPRLALNIPLYGAELAIKIGVKIAERFLDDGSGEVRDDVEPYPKWWTSPIYNLKNSPLLSKHQEYPWLFQLPITFVLVICHMPGMMLNLVLEQFRNLTAVYDYVLSIVTLGKYDAKASFSQVPGTGALQDLIDYTLPTRSLQHNVSEIQNHHDALSKFWSTVIDQLSASLTDRNVLYKLLQVLHKIVLLALILPLSLGKLAFYAVDFTLEQVLVLQCFLTVKLPRLVLNIPLYIADVMLGLYQQTKTTDPSLLWDEDGPDYAALMRLRPESERYEDLATRLSAQREKDYPGYVTPKRKPTTRWWSLPVRIVAKSNLISIHARYIWPLQLALSLTLFVVHLPGMLLNTVLQQFRKIETLYDYVLNAVTRGAYGEEENFEANWAIQLNSGKLRYLLNPTLALKSKMDFPNHGHYNQLSSDYLPGRNRQLSSFWRATSGLVRLDLNPQDNILYQGLEVLHKMGLIALFIPLFAGKLVLNIVDITLEQALVIECLLTVTVPRLVLNTPLYMKDKFTAWWTPLTPSSSKTVDSPRSSADFSSEEKEGVRPVVNYHSVGPHAPVPRAHGRDTHEPRFTVRLN